MATNETVKLNGNKAMSPAAVVAAQADAPVAKAKKARGKRMQFATRVVVAALTPAEYLVTLRSDHPLTDSEIDKCVKSGATLRSVYDAFKSAGIASAFSSEGNGASSNTWYRVKLAKS
jgi:hypothetical protein